LAQEADAVVRAHAAWALGVIANPEAMAALRSRLGVEGDEAVIREVEGAIGEATGSRLEPR